MIGIRIMINAIIIKGISTKVPKTCAIIFIINVKIIFIIKKRTIAPKINIITININNGERIIAAKINNGERIIAAKINNSESIIADKNNIKTI
jgi:hypothetical protein